MAMKFVARTLLLITLLSRSIAERGYRRHHRSLAEHPCKWSSLAHATYDLTPLEIPQHKDSYHLVDGDIPCTGVHEPVYSFMWNFCAPVTNQSMPHGICRPDQRGAAVQYLNRKSDGYKECHVIGRFNPLNVANEFNMLDPLDPSKGVSMTYAKGEKCPNGVLRSATIDVVCKNVQVVIDSALEPSKCQYHMVMHSWHGCPTECKVTANGLCSSHGHCAYDKAKKEAYCYCNEGYSGDGCDQPVAVSVQSTYYHNLQMGMMITLLIVAFLLIAVVGFMVRRISQYRKEHAMDYYSLQFGTGVASDYTDHGGTEMM